jgi:membrane protease YdiL (CAAX protease family)
MDYSDSNFRATWSARLQAVFEIIMVSGIVSSFLVSLVFAAIFGGKRLNIVEMDVGFFVKYQMFESAAAFLILWILMKARGETLPELGLGRQRWKNNVLLGIIAAPCLIIVSGVAGATFQHFLPEYAIEKNPLMEMINSPRQLMLFIVTGIVSGGFKEELQRAFILRRFRRHLGGARAGLVIWSLAFGAGHYVQGLQGVCVATVLGFVFGALYLMRKNLILPITAHAAYNTLALLIYWFIIGTNK